VIAELGAGYGRLAYVMRKMLPTCTYAILDLPEALICAQSWLGRALGGGVVDYGTSRAVAQLGRADFEAEGRVFLLLPHQIEMIGSDAVDAFVNIYSFAEMPPASIANYFRHLDRITDGVLYSKQRIVERNVLDSVQITEETYPIPPHWRRLSRLTSTLYDSFFEAAYATR
jgi:putative sugar O-methyltransferase